MLGLLLAAALAVPALNPCADSASADDLELCQRKTLDDAALSWVKAHDGQLPPDKVTAAWGKVQKAERAAFAKAHPALAAEARSARVAEAAARALGREKDTGKTLNIYVAPWCPHCRKATADIVKLRRWLSRRGVATKVIVGGDSMAKCEDYAAQFGDDTILDPNGREMPNGVPHFTVKDAAGGVLSDVGGMPQTGSSEELAAAFGLP